MEKIFENLKKFSNSSWFKGHSQEEKKHGIFIAYPLIRASFVLYGLVHKMKEYDMHHWRYFARLNLLLIFYDINKRYSKMDNRITNEFKLKYGFDLLFWSILASHYIPYRFSQFITYQYFIAFNKRLKSMRVFYACYVPVLVFSFFLYPYVFKIGDKISDLFLNTTYRIFVANYLKCQKVIY